MDIGIPKETAAREHRVALAPSGVKALVQQGARVWVENGRRRRGGLLRRRLRAGGRARSCTAAHEVFARASSWSAINAPSRAEYELLQPGQVVLASGRCRRRVPRTSARCTEREVTAVGVEVIEDDDGNAPVLTSMSEIAGRLALTIGSGLLLNEFGGKGILLSGAPGVPPANFVILGRRRARPLGGAGRARHGRPGDAARLSVEHLRYALEHLPRDGADDARHEAEHREGALASPTSSWARWRSAASARRMLVTREMLRLMKPRSVVMDLSIDMGGCFETSRPTSFPNPIYEVDGILHFCVPNLPSVAARSATLALTNALLPYLHEVARRGIDGALAAAPDLGRGTYLYRGRCRSESLARVFGVPYEPLPARRRGGRRALARALPAQGHHGRGGGEGRSARATTCGSTAAATTPRS